MKRMLTIVLFLFISCSLLPQDTVVKVTNDKKEQLSYNDDGKLHGQCLAWNAQGVLIGEANYKNGKKHGVWKIYFDNGELAYEMYYTDGEKTGTWKVYSKDGTIEKTKEFNP